MAQTGFTPIQIYSSSTTGNTPAAADLLNSTGGSELAINIFDGKLFYKDNAGAVQVIGWKVVPVSAGGTGQTSYTDGQLLIGNSTGNTLTKATLTAGTGITITNGAGAITINGSSGTVTSVTGTAPVSVATGTTTPVISLASGYGDTQNPYASKTANYVLAAPNGSAGVPTFRALVAADIPSLTGTYIPYTGASSAIDLNAKTVVNIANLGVNTTTVPTIKIRAIGDNNSSSRIAMRGYSSDANSSSIRVSKFRGTVGAPQAPQSGDSLGKFELAGYGTTASDAYPQASFEGLATEAWGATARGTKAIIKVTPNTTITQVTAVTVDQDSKVTLAGALAVTGTTTLATSLSGLAKLTSGVVSTATSGTDYAPATSGTSILYGNGAGGFSNVTIGTGVSFAAGTLSATGTGGTVTSVAALTLGTAGTDLSSTVANGTTTPVITLNVPTASAANRGALSAADWTTFNSKAPGVTFTTNYIPYGQGTPTLNQSAGLQFDGTNFTTTGYATATSFRPSSATVPTNGLYLPAANSVGWATNSTERMRIDSSGNVGIGVTAPLGRLALKGTGSFGTAYSSNEFQIFDPSGLNSANYGFYINQSYDTSTTGKFTLGVSDSNNHTYTLAFAVGGTERMTLNASGNLGIGTTNPSAGKLVVSGSSGNFIVESGGDAINFTKNGINYISTKGGSSAGLVFETGGANERMRIDSSGNLLVGYSGSNPWGARIVAFSSAALAHFETTSTTASVLELDVVANNTTQQALFVYSSGNAATNFIVYSNGNVQNRNNSYGAISDIKLKENIVDASPKLDDLLKVKIRNYNLIGSDIKHIGVVAQELAEVFPSMIDESPDKERVTKTREIEVPAVEEVLDDKGNVLTPAVEATTKTEEYTEDVLTGETTKSVKYSVFVPILIKAMQEQQALISSLTARLDVIEKAYIV